MRDIRYKPTKRSFLLGAASTLISAGAALADTPFTTYAFPAASAPTSRTAPTRFSEIVNVRDWGATGDGTTDDRAAIQAAFNFAYGVYTSPNGNANKYLNKAVYFPGGNYRINGPLYIVGAIGINVFGEGIEAVTLNFQGALTGNALIPSGTGSEITPILMLNGSSFGSISGMRLISYTDGGASTPVVGIYLYQDGLQGITSAIRFTDILIDTCWVGVLGGWGGNGSNCDNMTFTNVSLANCPLAGLRAVSQNALNWRVVGGGGQSCGSASTGPNGNQGALYSAVGGSISPILGPSMSVNTWDIICASSSPVFVAGGSSESLKCIGMAGTQCHVSSFAYRNENSLGCVFADIQNSGQLIASNVLFNPGNNNGAGKIIEMGNNGVAIFDILECPSNANACVISGTPGSKVYLRGSVFSGTPLTGFTGTIAQNI